MGQCMVRGNAKDLVLPPPDSNKFILLARHVSYATDDWQAGVRHLQSGIEQHMGKTWKFLRGALGRCEGSLDGLLCSYNARSRTPLVGHAQWETI